MSEASKSLLKELEQPTSAIEQGTTGRDKSEQGADGRDKSTPTDSKQCPSCKKYVDGGVKFCTYCGYRFEDEPPAGGQVAELLAPRRSSRSSTIARSPSQELRSSLAAHLTPVAAVRVRFRAARSLRELYMKAAATYVQQQAYDSAIEALQQALAAKSDSIQDSDVLFYLAYVYDGRMRDASRAFSTYLQAILSAPAFIDEILLYAHSLLTPDIAIEQSRWVLEEWEQQMKDKCAGPSNHMHLGLLIAHVYMFLGRFQIAQKYLKDAAKQDPDQAVSMTSYLFEGSALPPELADAETDAPTALTLAQLYQAIGNVRLGLQEIDHAITLGSGSADETFLAQAYQCKAELLVQSGNRQDAARYFSAVGGHYLTNEPGKALKPLRRAKELDPQDIQVYWALAEALRLEAQRLCSYNADKNFEQMQDRIEESLAVWEQGYNEIKHPDPDDVWTYFSRALMSYQLMRLPGAHPWAIVWQALALLEQAALCNRTAYTDVYLGGFYRYLGFSENALVLTQRAIDAMPKDSLILGERASTLYNLERYDEAEKLIDSMEEDSSDKWLDKRLRQAYILLRKKEFKESLELLNQLLEENAASVTDDMRLKIYNFRSYSYRHTGEIQRSLDDSAQVRNLYNKTDLDNWASYAWAAFFLGLKDIEEGGIGFAYDLFQQHLDVPGEDPGNVLGGLCLLAQGRLEEAETILAQSVTVSTTKRQLDDLLDNFPELESFVPELVQKPEVRAILDRIKQQTEERKAVLAPPPTLEDELKSAMQAYEGESDKSDGWAWIAIMAGLGRLYTEAERWQDAFETYRQLAEKAGERFPEAHEQQEKAMDQLFDQIDKAIKASQLDDSLMGQMRYLHSVLFPPEIDSARDLPASNQQRLGRLYCQVGYTRLLRGGEMASYLAGTDEARKELHLAMTKGEGPAGAFLRSLAFFVQNDQANLAANFARACRPMIGNPAGYWRLDMLLGEMAQGEEPIEGIAEVLQWVRAAATGYLEDIFQLSAQAPARALSTPSFTGLFLELGIDLIPDHLEQDSVFHDWVLMKDYVPDLRRRLQAELGITLPGVQVDICEAGSYRIRNFDVELATSTIQSGLHHSADSPEMRYTLASLETLKQLGIEEKELVAAAHPLTGALGYWTPAAYWEIISSHHEELWPDPFVFITYAIEAAVRGNLALLLDMQMAQWLSGSWGEDKAIKTRLDALLRDTETRFRFARLLRALAQEQVSLATPAAILDAITGLDLARGDFAELIHLIRLHMKPQLPGNQPDVQRIELPAAWEDKLLVCMQHQDGLNSFVVPQEETNELIQSCSNWIQPNMTGWKRALITRSAALRPFLWQLLHASFPLLCALSQEEILDERAPIQ